MMKGRLIRAQTTRSKTISCTGQGEAECGHGPTQHGAPILRTLGDFPGKAYNPESYKLKTPRLIVGGGIS